MKASDPRHPLYHSYLKFMRARDQFNGLKVEMGNFLNARPYEVRIEEHPEANQIRGILRVVTDPPAHWSSVLGEVIHNLRCSLDYVVFQLVIHCTGVAPGDDSRTQFPIYKTQPGFNSRGVPHDLAGTDAASRALIESMQPYVTGEDVKSPLWHLRMLSNWDKHRAITVTAATQTMSKVQARSAQIGIAYGVPFEQGSTLFWLEPTSSVTNFAEWAAEAEVEHEVSFQIAFVQPAHEHGLPVQTVLEAIGARVFEVISEINSRIFAPVWSGR